MTLREQILNILETERQAIDAAIFVIKSSKTLDAITLSLPASVAPAARGSERASNTPPNPTTRRATDRCPNCGRQRSADESGQAFGAHKRHCNGTVSTATVVDMNPLECPICHADDFKSRAAVGVHKKACDGVKRTATERAAHSQKKWANNNGGGKAVNRSRDEKRAANRRPAPANDEDDDIDFDPDEDVPNAFGRTRSTQETQPRPMLPSVRCDICDEGGFPDAKSMGIHKSRVHFGR